ncbi:MAG TPA: hypothetical protein VMR62_35790 [Bryobacteraceae bacterium]|jgi:ABC-type nitrate/sulfonate/bicarbonate transport system substrate-binding protein|nr:hypothetical protein [Bryobacteraceae bacterium]
MPAVLQYELEAPVTEEVVDRQELSRLADWLWEMHESPEPRPETAWFWTDDELARQRLAGGYEPDESQL